jgi:hypothetical protein
MKTDWAHEYRDQSWGDDNEDERGDHKRTQNSRPRAVINVP